MALEQGPDMENRDPNGLNDHVKVQFEEVFGEPDGVRSPDYCFKLAFSCFNFGKNFCYKLYAFLCSSCLALFWGCEFAMAAFGHIWCFTPFLRQWAMVCGCMQKIFGTCINCCLGTTCETCGMLFSRIVITKK